MQLQLTMRCVGALPDAQHNCIGFIPEGREVKTREYQKLSQLCTNPQLVMRPFKRKKTPNT